MKKILAVLLALLMIGLCACGGQNGNKATDSPAQTGKAAEPAVGEAAEAEDDYRVLRVGTMDSGGSFDPWSGTSGPQNYLAFETILMRTGTGEYEPWLAESVEWVDDTTLEIKLRDDAYFADGDQVLGEDVVYTFYKSATAASVMAVHFSNIDFEASTVSEDGLTVTFKLKQPYGPLMAYMDIPYVVNKSACEDWGPSDERWWDSPPTSSAYEIVENVSGSHVTFRLREDYWNKDRMPQWDEIVINFYSNPTAMFIAFETGEIDIVLGVQNNDVDRLKSGDIQNAENIAYKQIPSKASYLLCMSPYKEEFNDIKVREAIAHVIDQDAIGAVAFGGEYLKSDSVICEGVNFYKSTGLYELDTEYAKQCMAESAYPDGFEINVVTMESDAPIWEVIQGCLAPLNISVNFQSYDMATSIGLWMQEDGSDCMLITAAGGNVTREPYADLSANWQNGMLCPARVLDPEYNEIFSKFVYTADTAVREEYCGKIQQWLHDNYHCIPCGQPVYTFAYRSDKVGSCDFFSATRANMLYASPAA
ncbi:MAG: ABC transporter substrate-binding protein [Oscillospiraceae bacterium]